MRNALRRGSLLSTIIAGLLMLTSTGALAHFCNNVSRSDQGNAAAGANAPVWHTLDFADAVAEDVADGLYDEEEGECVYAYWIDNGGPATATIFGIGVLAGKNKNHHLVHDGRGIDHLDFGLYFAALAECVEPELD